MLSRGRYVLNDGTCGMMTFVNGEIGGTLRPVMLTSTPLHVL